LERKDKTDIKKEILKKYKEVKVGKKEKVDKTRKEYEYAPEGWMTKKPIAEILGVSIKYLNERIKVLLEKNPEWARNYSIPRGHIIKHYSPEMIEALRIEAESAKEAPDGWMTINSLSNSLGVNTRVINKIINKFRVNNPKWFKKFKTSTGHLWIHISPELIEIVKEDINSREKAPEGWMTENALKEKLSIHHRTVGAIANKFRESNPEWFREFWTETGNVWEYISPALVEIISKELGSVEFAPDGWLTVNRLAKKIGSGAITVRRRAEKYRAINPDWFIKYKIVVKGTKSGRIEEHLSPELQEKIKEELGK